VTAHSSTITIIGAGVVGLWQALTLARAGFAVQVIERSPRSVPFAGAASRYAGAMLAPDCEAESAPQIVRNLGRDAIAMWRAVYPDVVANGSLVVAPPREPGELARYAKLTERHRRLSAGELAALEPELAANFDSALFFPGEAHMAAPAALAHVLGAVEAHGVRVLFDDTAQPDISQSQVTIDCRGISAASTLPGLRAVRGERVIVRARDVHLARPVRLLHPRVPLYIVPWPDAVFMIGATVIESSDGGPMSVRSAIELLSAACSVHAGFAEAEILDLGAGLRPAFADNIPRAFVSKDGHTISVNGAYRHGYLLAPVLADAVAGYLAGRPDHPLLVRS
jgi:glycine oxidase